jgi:asparagine synthase (glutamine-hydrolysing)
MTAIAGLIRFDDAPVDRAVIARMLNLLTPYGRDAQQSLFLTGAAFLRTLLRITPEDSLDRQPVAHPESQTLVLFDGRLDNRDELAESLDITPAELRLMADSTLALHACLRWDTAAVDRLLGDFALACWQPRARRLWLARDPLGTRPLYWHRTPDFFAFATMPKALFAIPGVEQAICEERLHDYLCLLPMIGPESFFKDIYRVEPGHLLLLEGREISTRRHHRWDPDKELQLPSDDDYLDAFGEQLERAVACRLRASGPIASYLSSGFDSATVTALAARQLAARGEGLIAYTAVPREGFDGPVFEGRHADEGPAARALAARFPNITHHLIRPDGTAPVDLLEQDVERLDRPPLNPCNMVWVNAIQADAAGRGAKVLLTGTMGNMTISYDGREYLPWLFASGRWATWWREASALKEGHPPRRWRGLLAQSITPHLPPALGRVIERLRGRRSQALTDYTAIHPAFMRRMDSASRARATGWDLDHLRPRAVGRRKRIAALDRIDIGDHSASLNPRGLEMRDPTADRRLIELCLAIPDHQYLRDGQNRWLLRRLMRGVLPPEILCADTRGLQAADWHEAAGASLPRMREEIGRQRASGVGEYLDLDSLMASLDDWPSAGWCEPATVQRYRLKLLRGLSVGAFVRQVEDNNA